MLEKEATGEARKLEKKEKMGGEKIICLPRPEEKKLTPLDIYENRTVTFLLFTTKKKTHYIT